MKISSLPRTSQKIFAVKAKDQAKVWNRLLKRVDDNTLVSILETLIYSSDPVKNKQWRFAGLALNELTIRPWANVNHVQLDYLRETIRAKSKLCFSSNSYSLETAGLNEKTGVIHPYAYSEVAKKIRIQWEKSGLDKSLNSYIREEVEKDDAEYLKSHTITYLLPKEREDYLVTFDHGSINIGTRVPEDGWYIFVLDAKRQKLFAGIKETGNFHHTSFLGGVPVACAGEFKVYNGKIIRILLRSGHYRPTPEHGEKLHHFLEKENNLGPKETSRLVIEPYAN